LAALIGDFLWKNPASAVAISHLSHEKKI